MPWRKAWQSTPVSLHGEFQGQRSLVGYSPWGCKESDTAEQVTFSFSILKINFKAIMQKVAYYIYVRMINISNNDVQGKSLKKNIFILVNIFIYPEYLYL